VNRSPRSLLQHPVLRTLLFERFLVTASATLAFAAVAMGRVHPAEITSLMDARILSLFFVLTIAVELGKESGLFDFLVVRVLERVRTARGLAFAMAGVTGVLAAFLTNDVALFLVIPFTMLFRRVQDLPLSRYVVFEVLAANLLGAISPIGNPQNLFLYERGRFSPTVFIQTQLPLVVFGALLLAGAILLFIRPKSLEPPRPARFDIDPLPAAGFVLLITAQTMSLLGGVSPIIPLLLSLPAALLLGRKLEHADFSLVLVFALLFIGIPGLERGRLYQHLDPEKIFGHHAIGLLLSGALLSQFVSNVPAALLLAPAVASRSGFQGLLYGVTVGACGSPVGSVANLIGAQLYTVEGGKPSRFWAFFCSLSSVLLLLMAGFGALLLATQKDR
jgi:Na+/H+ antiporter NhaD/arsenite permease-like protein